MVEPRARLLVLTLPAFLGLMHAPLGAAPPPAVRELRVQKVGDITYFHVQLATPQRMTPDGEARLVPQDGQATHVCRRMADQRGMARPPAGPPPGAPIGRGAPPRA